MAGGAANVTTELIPVELEKMSFHPPTSAEQNSVYMFKAMASFFSSLLLDIFTYHFTWRSWWLKTQLFQATWVSMLSLM